MTVLATILNGSSNKDIRDTLNSALARILALEASLAGSGGGGTPTPAPTPTVTLSAAQSKPEGNSGATIFSYTVTRSSTVGAISVPWSFTAGATSGDDFTGGTYPAGGAVAFADGQATGTIAISVNGDTATEADEAFTIAISAPSGYAAGAAMSATGTIVNDDTAFVAPTLLAPLYADDFEAPVGTSSFAARAGWTSQDQAFGGLEVKDGYVHNINEYGPGGSAFIGGSLGDHVVTYGYSTVDGNGNAYEDGRQAFYAWYQDINNNVRVEIAKGAQRLQIRVTVGGVDKGEAHWVRAAFKTKGELRLMLRDGRFHAMLDGVWLSQVDGIYSYPLDVIDWTAQLPSANRQGRVGVQIQLYRYPVLEYVKVEPLALAIDSIDEFVGRDSLTATGGSAKLAMTMAAGTNPTSWVYRLLTPGTLAEVKAWAPLANVAVNGSAVTAFAFLPTGGPYIVQAGYVDGSDGKARVNYSRAALSGIRGETWGQSNSLYRQGPVDGNTPALNVKTAWAAVTLTSGQISGAPAGGWATPSNSYLVTGMHEMARVLSGLLGKPVGIGAQGVGSTGIDFLSPAGVGWSTLTTALAARRGIVEFMIWDQGENDADSAANPTYYATNFRNNLLPGLRTVCNNPDLPVFISPVGRFASTGSAAPYPDIGPVQCDRQRDTLQQQYLLIDAAEPKVFIGDYKLGTEHNGSDVYHYSNRTMGYPEMGRRAAYSVAKYMGVNVADGRGAIVTSAARAGALVDLTLDLNGGSGITGPTNFATGNVPTPTLQGLLGFQVSKDDFATTLAISSVAIVSGKLRITLAADPGAAVKVRSHYGWSYDDTSLFYTGYADGRAPIPVAPITSPIAAA